MNEKEKQLADKILDLANSLTNAIDISNAVHAYETLINAVHKRLAAEQNSF